MTAATRTIYLAWLERHGGGRDNLVIELLVEAVEQHARTRLDAAVHAARRYRAERDEARQHLHPQSSCWETPS